MPLETENTALANAQRPDVLREENVLAGDKGLNVKSQLVCPVDAIGARFEGPDHLGMPTGPSGELLERARAWPGVLAVAYAADELIFPAGGFATGVYLVEKGLVGLFPKGEGNQPGLHLVGPGEFLGLEGWLRHPRPRYQGAARALTPVSLLFFPPSVWEKAVADEDFRAQVFATLGQMWAQLLTKAQVLGDGQRAVLWAFQRWGEPTPQGLRLPLTPGRLAQALGLPRATVKQALARLFVAQDGEALMLPHTPAHRVSSMMSR